MQTTHQAVEIILQLDADNLKLLFDCYHVQRTEGDLSHKLVDLKDKIGHIQFSSVPDRSTPDQGEVNYAHIFAVIKAMGYDQPLGAELLSNLVFEVCRSCRDLVRFGGFNSVFECDAGDDLGEIVKAA